ncbi:MAG: lytic transglycosylase domain-containing protein [Treponema sp.]|nr:lytic transglycosylase domain-containing protein [Treponema sp.]
MPRFFFLISLFSLTGYAASCDVNTVLDLSRNEAARRLKTGDIAFILDNPPERMAELARIHISAPYYAGLLLKARRLDQGVEGDGMREAALFEAALDGKGRLQREAARELMSLVQEGDAPRALLVQLESKGRGAPALRAACLYKLGRFAEIEALYKDAADPGPWDRALMLLSNLELGSPDPEALSDYFLDQGSGVSGDTALTEARRWALDEIRERLPDVIGLPRAAAAAGRLSVGRSSYAEGLAHFRKTLEQEEGLFFRYSGLLDDLGRAFQFGSSQNEGTDLFLGWNTRIQKGELDGKGLDVPGIRYRLLYYMGRIQRRLGHYAQGSGYFVRALDFAPDALQADACIWYILSISLQEQPQETAALIRKYISRWNQDRYFADILDRLARYLTANRRWSSLGEIFSLIENRSDGESIAKYAYILGRAVSEGFLPAAPKSAEDYFRIVLAQGNASFYYRVMAASRLGVKVVPAQKASGRVSVDPWSDDLEFFLGFFEYGAAGLAYTYLRDDTDRFSPEELRILAAAFANAERWEESVRIVSSYTDRAGGVLDRQDMELNYPRAFKDLVETHARNEDIPQALLFGLIRTESAFAPEIRSWAGAEGLTQLMPATALDMAGRVIRRGGPDYTGGGAINLKDPGVNIHLGAVYLRYLMDRTESPMLALLAYNGGIGRLRRWRNAEADLPGDLFLETIEYNETREYARKVLAAAAVYGYLYYGMTMEEVIADII